MANDEFYKKFHASDPAEDDIDLEQQPFLLPIEDVFTIRDVGIVATGRVERGGIRVGQEVEIVGIRDTRRTIVTGIELSRQLVDAALPGDNVGLLLRGVEPHQVQRGQVLSFPGSIGQYTKFEAEAFFLEPADGGSSEKITVNRTADFYIRTTQIKGTIGFSPKQTVIAKGQDAYIGVMLKTPMALEVGLRFVIREGDRTIGAGMISRLGGNAEWFSESGRTNPRETYSAPTDLANSAEADAPFGISFGAPIEDYFEDGATSTPPKPHSDFEVFLGTGSDELGITSILALSRPIENDHFGMATNSLFEKVLKQLSRRYGEPDNLVNELRENALFSEDSEFQKSIHYNDRTILASWEIVPSNDITKEEARNKIDTISLRVHGDDTDSSRIVLRYTSLGQYVLDKIEESDDESAL